MHSIWRAFFSAWPGVSTAPVPPPPPPHCGSTLYVATPYLNSSIFSIQREVLPVHGVLKPIFLHPVGLVERRALSSDSTYIVSSRKFHLKKILLVRWPQSVGTPNTVIIVKASRLRSEGMERFLPWRRNNVVIRDLSVLHTDWITAAREVWIKDNHVTRLELWFYWQLALKQHQPCRVVWLEWVDFCPTRSNKSTCNHISTKGKSFNS